MLDAINGMILVIKILIVYSEVGSNVCNTDPCLKQAALNSSGYSLVSDSESPVLIPGQCIYAT